MKLNFSQLLLLCALPPTIAAQNATSKTVPLRHLIQGSASSFVTARVLTELSDPGGEVHEMIQHSPAVVVDGTGVVMVPTALVKPGEAFVEVAGDGAGEMPLDIPQPKVKSVEILIDGATKRFGTKTVHEDAKLGLSFLKIDGLDGRKLTALPLLQTKPSPPEIGQQIFAVQKLGRDFGFAPYYTRGELVGEIKMPHRAWALSVRVPHGTPIYNKSGDLLGLASQNLSPKLGAEAMSPFGFLLATPQTAGGLTFLVPADRIVGAVQAAVRAVTKAPTDKVKK